MTNINVLKERQGVRISDPSGRFRAHPAGKVEHSIMELIDNMLIYGHNKGIVSILHESRFVKYCFRNNGTDDKIPTPERIIEILECAGAKISAGEKTSICGMGIEVFALESRPNPYSTVYVDINIFRNGQTYGGRITYCGADNTIRYDYFPPKPTKEKENIFEITYSGCDNMTDKQLRLFKAKICEKLYYLDHKFTIKFKVDKNEETLVPCDLMYKNFLSGTDKFLERTLSYKFHNEYKTIRIEMADVSEISRSENACFADNITSTKKKVEPSLSGFRTKFGDMITVHGDDIGWKFVGKKNGKHPTLNAIRGIIDFGDDCSELFNQIHKESLIKCDTNVTIEKLVNFFNEGIEFFDENDDKVDIFKDIIVPFLSTHASDKTRDDSELENIFKSNKELQETVRNILTEYFTKEQQKSLFDLSIGKLAKWSEFELK